MLMSMPSINIFWKGALGRYPWKINMEPCKAHQILFVSNDTIVAGSNIDVPKGEQQAARMAPF
jgi:hypothetical protein